MATARQKVEKRLRELRRINKKIERVHELLVEINAKYPDEVYGPEFEYISQVEQDVRMVGNRIGKLEDLLGRNDVTDDDLDASFR